MNVQLAKRNLEASVGEAGFDWTVEVERGDDLTVRLWNGPQEFLKVIAISGSFKTRVSAGRESTSVGGCARGRFVLIAAIL